MDQTERQWLRQRAMNVLGHELRTPTTTIRGLAEALDAGVDPAARPQIVDALVRNARRLETLVDDLLTATSIATALPVGPTSDIELAAQFTEQWPEASGLEISGAVRASARPQSVARIVAAILDNARLYGDRPVTVTCSRTDRAFVEVVSPGPTLPDADIRFALEPFWRGERAVTTAPGLGIGLTVASTLATHEGGRIWIEGRPGGGVVTFLELPLP